MKTLELIMREDTIIVCNSRKKEERESRSMSYKKRAENLVERSK
jgi:hypothetical protein